VLRGTKTYRLRAPQGQRISAIVVNGKKLPAENGQVKLTAADRCVVSFT
jgi:hypothetical protein